eukprot:UN07191
MSDEKGNSTGNNTGNNRIDVAVLQFDNAANPENICFNKHYRKATLIGKACSIRTQFWRSGRHIINLKVYNCGHVGVGIVGRSFDISVGKWVGADKRSWAIWESGSRHKGSEFTKGYALTKGGNTIITIEVDLDERLLFIAINGQYIKTDPVAYNIPKQVAIGVSLWQSDDTVEIIQYTKPLD